MEEVENKETTSNNKSSMLIVLAVVVFLGLVGYGLYAGKNNKATPDDSMMAENETSIMVDEAMTNEDESKENNGDMMEGEMAGKVTIRLTTSGFVPQNITVKKGTKVTWINESGRVATVDSSVHPTHQDHPPLNLGEFSDGEELSLTFDEAGTYRYHDHLNASLFGSVVVEE